MKIKHVAIIVGIFAVLGLLVFAGLKANVHDLKRAEAKEASTPKPGSDAYCREKSSDLTVGLSLTDIYPECKAWQDRRDEVERKKEVAALPPKARLICERHHDFDPEACEAIAKREVEVGFTPAEIRASWGNPDHINSSFMGGHTTEQWVYENQGQYLYLDDGVLTSWQTNN